MENIKQLEKVNFHLFFHIGEPFANTEDANTEPMYDLARSGHKAIEQAIRQIPGNVVYFDTYGNELPGRTDDSLDDVRVDIYDHEGTYEFEHRRVMQQISFFSSKEISPELAHAATSFAIEKITEAAGGAMRVDFARAVMEKTYRVVESEPYSFL